MQTCPNCGSEARNGAKFCTSCGYRFDENGEPDTLVSAESAVDANSAWSSRESAAEADRPNDGWPVAPGILATEESGWRESDATEPRAELVDAPTSDDDLPGFWPESVAESWPAPPTQSDRSQRGPLLSLEQSLDEPTGQENDAAAWQDDRSQTHILEMLDELRAAIVANPANGSFDLSGVVSDLEVAVTVPGAVPPDDLAELRDALFAARENPRDVDTIVDLTKRIDSLVSLVIAYDRAVAAIERSLAVMKKFQPANDSNTDGDVASRESAE